MAISSMARWRRCLSLGLAKRRARSRFWRSLIRDQVPTDVQMHRHVADGHAAAQLQGISLEGLGVAASRVGERDLDLAHDAAGEAFDAWDGQDDQGGAVADGDGPEAALDLAARLDLGRAAGGAAAGLGFLADGEDRGAVLVVSASVVVAADAEGVIQQTGGHADLPVWSP